jgi:hypothetical protein
VCRFGDCETHNAHAALFYRPFDPLARHAGLATRERERDSWSKNKQCLRRATPIRIQTELPSFQIRLRRSNLFSRVAQNRELSRERE